MRYTMREQPTLILTKSSSFILVMLKSPQLLIFAPKVDLLPYLAFLTCFNDEVLYLKMSNGEMGTLHIFNIGYEDKCLCYMPRAGDPLSSNHFMIIQSSGFKDSSRLFNDSYVQSFWGAFFTIHHWDLAANIVGKGYKCVRLRGRKQAGSGAHIKQSIFLSVFREDNGVLFYLNNFSRIL